MNLDSCLKKRHVGPQIIASRDFALLSFFVMNDHPQTAFVHKEFFVFYPKGNIAYLVLHIGFESVKNRTALDNSGNNNNAILSPEVGLSVTESKCGSAVTLRGGRLLFPRFNSRPREAITIALWLKLDSVSGTATLFKTTGSGAKYNLHVADGIVRWSHVDDLGHVTFSMETTRMVDPLDWLHVAATYDAHINKSKIILNGEVFDEREGHGLLSQNWDGEVGIGIPGGIQGLMDEFYMYNHALAASDLGDLSEECNPGAGNICFKQLLTILLYHDSP